jgi:hypothetical protein
MRVNILSIARMYISGGIIQFKIVVECCKENGDIYIGSNGQIKLWDLRVQYTLFEAVISQEGSILSTALHTRLIPI